MPPFDADLTVIADRYEVLGLLGVGGMGAVYKVRDRELDEVVALKMLRQELAYAPDIVERFRREVKLARRVTHPNVARTFDLGEHAGERFLTMELIEGESLHDMVKRHRALPLPQIVDVLSKVCAGLEAAHAAGVVHRDLKPDNVMIARGSGRVAITDFGVACAQDRGAALRTAAAVGTPAYMAPEQVEAKPDVDERADIYALGAMAFELLTGHLPFEADSVFAVASMRLTQPPPDPRVHRPDLPEGIAELVQRCMARRPEDRPKAARDVAATLASLALPTAEQGSNPPVSAPPSMANTSDGGSKTVAVLPFRNASGAEEDDYLVDGLTDDLIDGLSMTPGLRVRPRSLVMQLRASNTDPRQLGRELDVQVVVEGSVRAARDSLRVSARVLSVADGFQIWAQRFDGARADVLVMSDQVSLAVAEALAVRKPVRQRAPTDPVAIDLYLRGRHEFLKFWGPANDRALELLRQAHERAPEDALIMSGYASSLARNIAVADPSGRASREQLAREMAEKAVAAAPHLAEAHVGHALVCLDAPDPVGAAAGVSRALALSPLCPDAHELRSRLLLEVGEPRDAIASAERTMKLDPRMIHLQYGVIGRAYGELRDDEEASRIFARVPADAEHAGLYWMQRVRMAVWRRDIDAVRDGYEEAIRASSSREGRFLMMRRLAKASLSKKPLEDLVLTPNMRNRTRSFIHQLEAEVQCSIGQGDRAMTEIERAIAVGLFDIAWMDRCPLLDGVRGHPRFAELRKEVLVRASRALVELQGRDATLAS